MSYNEWKLRVVKLLNESGHSSLARAAMGGNDLEDIRGDEAVEAFYVEKLSSHEYAQQLIDEWLLFGPGGE